MEATMCYANILVSVDLSAASPARVQLAAGLAGRFEATLTGAAARSVPAPVLVQDIYDAQCKEAKNREAVQAELDQAHELFAHNAGAGIKTDWRPGFTGPITHLVEQARSADLIVIGRHGAEDADPGELGAAPGPVLMEAGRPILVVPPKVEHLSAARIVVAWKDTAEARRSVSAALGFLRRADQVFVASFGEGARFEGAEDIAGHLTRHGTSATVHLLKDALGAGDEIMHFARREEADLIVMGGYGHSRLREWAFGGATRDILQRAPVCCLMCH
jgi:nucleotide-binding universal stress UspA family protein